MPPHLRKEAAVGRRSAQHTIKPIFFCTCRECADPIPSVAPTEHTASRVKGRYLTWAEHSAHSQRQKGEEIAARRHEAAGTNLDAPELMLPSTPEFSLGSLSPVAGPQAPVQRKRTGITSPLRGSTPPWPPSVAPADNLKPIRRKLNSHKRPVLLEKDVLLHAKLKEYQKFLDKERLVNVAQAAEKQPLAFRSSLQLRSSSPLTGFLEDIDLSLDPQHSANYATIILEEELQRMLAFIDTILAQGISTVTLRLKATILLRDINSELAALWSMKRTAYDKQCQVAREENLLRTGNVILLVLLADH